MTDRDARIEAANNVAMLYSGGPLSGHWVEAILAAADAAVPRAAWWERIKCERCRNGGIVSCEPGPCGHGGHMCGECDGSGWGRRLVFAPCDTCKGDQFVCKWADQPRPPLCKPRNGGMAHKDCPPCPDCDDGTQRRRLLEAALSPEHGGLAQLVTREAALRLVQDEGERRWLLEQMGGMELWVGVVGGDLHYTPESKVKPGVYRLVPEKETDR